MRDDPVVVALVQRARDGDQGAWDAIVARYAPLVLAVCRRHRLSPADTDDVGACVWLRLVERLDAIRDPAALPGWLATTTRRECLNVLRAKSRESVHDIDDVPDGVVPASDEWLLTQERHIALRVAFAELPERCRRLLALLFTDPPTPYATIVATLGLRQGAIGPTRQRCLERLRRSEPLAALAQSSPASTEGR
jgi:RNA polymerase sigma factor (sigma-70 family)